MRVFYWRSERGNFGDELNLYLWPKLCPELRWTPAPSDEAAPLAGSPGSADALFVGIGTLLTEILPANGRKIIFGSGTRAVRQATPDDAWDVYCVRGPMTADALGLARHLAVTDPAALLADLPAPAIERRHGCAYMPHYYNDDPAMAALCASLGIHYISPSAAVPEILHDIRGSEVVISEAMHGAIVADTFRVPWVPVVTRPGEPEFKWLDWCASLGIDYRPHLLRPVWTLPEGAGLLARAKSGARGAVAARALARLRDAAPRSLSDESTLNARLSGLRSAFDRFRGARSAPTSPAS